MVWIKPKGYSRTAIDNAGNILINQSSAKDQKSGAIEILDNWRACHSYPMHIFKKRLKNRAFCLDKNALIAQRLKRVPSIITKLKRKYSGKNASMKLSQIQDIGGCRAVLSDVSLVYELYYDHYIKSDLKHKLVNEKDYIKYPKVDGYRCIHLIYKYYSDKGKSEDYNGLLIEIQIRSKLQHLWATAIEIVDFFTKQSIKLNEGKQEWVDFFRLVSSVFAKIENCPIVPNTPNDILELKRLIKEKESALQVIKIMMRWAATINIVEKSIKSDKNAKFFLLELDINTEKLVVRTYRKDQEKNAIQDYSNLENNNVGKKGYDVVLVGVDTTNDLRKAYPNYFVDVEEFLFYLQEIIK